MPLKNIISFCFHYLKKFIYGFIYPIYYYELKLKFLFIIAFFSCLAKIFIKYYLILANDKLESYYFIYYKIFPHTVYYNTIREAALYLSFRSLLFEILLFSFLYFYAMLKLKNNYREESVSAIIFPYIFSIIGCIPLIDFLIQYLSLWFVSVQLNELSGDLLFSKKIKTFIVFFSFMMILKFTLLTIWRI